MEIPNMTSGMIKPILAAPLQHDPCDHQNQAGNLHYDQADRSQPSELAFMKESVQRRKDGNQYVYLTDGFADQFTGSPQSPPFTSSTLDLLV